jgi:hypothetical protein
MYLQSFNIICDINKESNHIPGEVGALACLFVYIYVCIYVCMYVYMYVVCMYVCMYVWIYACMSLYKRKTRLYCKMTGDRIKLPAVKYI